MNSINNNKHSNSEHSQQPFSTASSFHQHSSASPAGPSRPVSATPSALSPSSASSASNSKQSDEFDGIDLTGDSTDEEDATLSKRARELSDDSVGSTSVVAVRARARLPRRAAAVAPGAYAARKSGAQNSATTKRRVKVAPFVSRDGEWSYAVGDAFVRAQEKLSARQRLIVGPASGNEQATKIWHDTQAARKIVGPKRLPDERLFEDMIHKANSEEIGNLAQRRIRVVPQPGGKDRSPPFDFVYTNRVIYEGNFLPITPKGCACQGDCFDPDNYESCACRKRQELAATSRMGSVHTRSALKGFAYGRDGNISQERFEANEPIVECHSACGCGPECSNRVVDKRPSIAVDIFDTGNAGWAVRNPHSYDADPSRGILERYEERTIPRGTPLGIYAGQMILREGMIERGEISDEVKRNYLFDVDPWTTAEDIGFFDWRKQKKVNLGERAREEYKGAFVIDGFSWGNWTRFCNHKCASYNAAARPVVVDDDDPRRPMWVFFAARDIAPGEEITIAYHHASDVGELNEEKLKAFKKASNRRRRLAQEDKRCHCKEELCYGILFEISNDDVPSDEEGGCDDDDAMAAE